MCACLVPTPAILCPFSDTTFSVSFQHQPEWVMFCNTMTQSNLGEGEFISAYTPETEGSLGRDRMHLSFVCSDTGINRPTEWAAQTVTCGAWHLELTINN